MSDIVEDLREEIAALARSELDNPMLGEAVAEIERLRDFIAKMERGYKGFRDTAEAEYARLHAEIDRRAVEEGRLRGLLRSEMEEWRRLRLAFNASDDRHMACLNRAAALREALGDAPSERD